MKCAVGDTVQVSAQISGHPFRLGEVLEVVEIIEDASGNNLYRATRADGEWANLLEDEVRRMCKKPQKSMTPSEEKTAEERARNRAITDARINLSQIMKHQTISTDTWRYDYCLEIESLRLTNQRLEAEVERMKKVIRRTELEIRNTNAPFHTQERLKEECSRLRSLESRGEKKGER